MCACEEDEVVWLGLESVTVIIGISSEGDSCGESTSTEGISTVEGPSSGGRIASSSSEAPDLQGRGGNASTGGVPVDGPTDGSGVSKLSTLTPSGGPLGGTRLVVASGLLGKGGGWKLEGPLAEPGMSLFLGIGGQSFSQPR